jgi:hypothetical protein
VTTPSEFMAAASTLGDDQLADMVRAAMLTQAVGTRQLWLRQLELALDGYGGERNRALTDRLRHAIQHVASGLGGG